MQYCKIETNSMLKYEDWSIWPTLIFIKIIGSDTLWFPLPLSGPYMYVLSLWINVTGENWRNYQGENPVLLPWIVNFVWWKFWFLYGVMPLIDMRIDKQNVHIGNCDMLYAYFYNLKKFYTDKLDMWKLNSSHSAQRKTRERIRGNCVVLPDPSLGSCWMHKA